MEKHVQKYVDDFMADIIARNPGEKEFHQAVHEVVESLAPYILENPVLQKMKVLERIAEPERIVMFRVPWLNDKGEIEINKGYRVEMNSAIGPYKGGIRFHSSVNLSILKFLAFEQTFKNSLTTLPMRSLWRYAVRIHPVRCLAGYSGICGLWLIICAKILPLAIVINKSELRHGILQGR